jgi:hypothetical protein
MKKISIRKNERGSALVYILIAIALLAALTLTFMEPSGQQTQSQNTFKTVSALQTQADFIISSVQECVITYPKGDFTIDNSGLGTDPGAMKRYPINPNSDHLPVASRSGNQEVTELRCPGVTSEDNWRDSAGVLNDNGNDNDHPKIFGVTTGKTFPPTPELFNPWQWYNGNDGVFFWTFTDKTDAYLLTAVNKLDELYSECEADVIDASGGAEDIDSDSNYSCANGNICFRVWIRATGSAVYNGDTDGDEAACP